MRGVGGARGVRAGARRALVPLAPSACGRPLSGSRAAWDCARRDPEPFDWYQRYSGLKDIVGQYIKKTDHMLMSGCGNSRLTEDMFEDGARAASANPRSRA